jgi:hypothetical protein
MKKDNNFVLFMITTSMGMSTNMNIELQREFLETPANLPPEYRAYRILYWFEGTKFPVIGQVIYLPDPTIARRIEGAVYASV